MTSILRAAKSPEKVEVQGRMDNSMPVRTAPPPPRWLGLLAPSSDLVTPGGFASKHCAASRSKIWRAQKLTPTAYVPAAQDGSRQGAPGFLSRTTSLASTMQGREGGP